MSSNQTPSEKKKHQFRGEMSQRNKKILQSAILALIVFAVATYYLWNHFVIEANEVRYQTALRQSSEQQTTSVLAYVEQMRGALQETSEAITALQKERFQPDLDFLNGQLEEYIKLDKLGEAVLSAKVYQKKALQRNDEIEQSLSFIEVDRINQGLQEEWVFPEAVEERADSDWLLYWVVGVRDAFAEEDSPVSAVLLVKTELQGLLEANKQAANDLSVQRVELLQKVRLYGNKRFLSVGNSSDDLGEHTRELGEGLWQLTVYGSSDFKRIVSIIPLWFVLVLASFFILCVSSVLWLAKTLPQEVLDGIQGIELPDRHIEPGEENTEEAGESLVSEKEQITTDPLSLNNAQEDDDGLGSQDLSKSEIILTESFLVPANIFRSYDIRGVVGKELSLELAELIGRAIASEVLSVGEQSLLVGYDARTHSPEICERLIQGIQRTGCHVIEAGLVPTPLLNFATVFSEATSSGVIVTASHNPKDYNGFKIIIDGKSLHDEGIQQIRDRIEDGKMVEKEGESTRSVADFSEDYVETVLADVAVASDMAVVVDAANGAASELAPRLLEELGCVATPLFCEFDGNFPNHDPDPCQTENLQALIDKVAEVNADLGVALDGDGDRLVIVTPKGNIIWPDQLMMIFVKDLVTRNPGCDVIYDVKSTRFLGQLISQCGGRPVMWKTGHSQIKNKMLETGALLGGEYSGHIFFKERWFGFDDGLYATARLLEILSLSDQSLDEMLDDMPKSESTPEIKIDVDDADKFDLVDRLINESDWESGEKTTIDGIRVDFAKGWGLVRASNTSPALTLRFEGVDKDAVIQLKQIFKRELRKVSSHLDLSAL